MFSCPLTVNHVMAAGKRQIQISAGLNLGEIETICATFIVKTNGKPNFSDLLLDSTP